MTHEEHLQRIDELASQLAAELVQATDDGVSHALILPRLVRIFRASFGEMPAGFSVPGLGG